MAFAAIGAAGQGDQTSRLKRFLLIRDHAARRRLGREKCVGKGNFLDSRHSGIFFERRIEEKHDRQLQSFARPELLLTETEAGDLVEIGAGAVWAYIEH